MAMAHNLRVLVARHPRARVSTRPRRNSTFQNGSPFSYKRAWRRSQVRVNRPVVVAKLAILPSPHTVRHHACNFSMRLFVGVACRMMPCCMRRGALSLGCTVRPSNRVQEKEEADKRQEVLQQMRQFMLVPGTSDIHARLRKISPNALRNIEAKDITELDLMCDSPLARQSPCIYQLTCKWCRCMRISHTICDPYESTQRVHREASKARLLIISTNKTLPEQVQQTQEILCGQKDTFVSDMLTVGLLPVLWRDVSVQENRRRGLPSEPELL